MKVSCYLAVSRTGSVKMTKTKPTRLGSGELSVQVNLTIPEEYFRKPEPVVNITVPRGVVNVDADVVSVEATQEVKAEAVADADPFRLPKGLSIAGWRVDRMEGSDDLTDEDMPLCVLVRGSDVSRAFRRTRKAAFDAAVERAEKMDHDLDSSDHDVILRVTDSDPMPEGWEFASFLKHPGSSMWEATIRRLEPRPKKDRVPNALTGKGLNRTIALMAAIRQVDEQNLGGE
jgi:hypothetical protein